MAGSIVLDSVHVIYGDTCALDVEHLSISPGERVFVLGRSGSGKTTLARVVKGRVRPSTGSVTVLGKQLRTSSNSARRRMQRRIAMIDQEYYLIPRLRVVENVLLGSLGRVSPWKSLLGWYPTEEWLKAESVLHEVDLERLARRRVESLSGGQRQRAAIARALMQEAEIILADEPVSNLDPELAEDAMELLVECAQRRDVTLVVSLHQPAIARKFATRIIGLSEGCVVYDGPPERFTEDKASFLYTGRAEDSPGAAPPPSAAVSRPQLRVIDGSHE